MPDPRNNDAAAALEDYLTRIERLEDAIDTAKNEIADIYADVKLDGFAVQAVKKMVRARKIDRVKEIDTDELYDSAAGGK